MGLATGGGTAESSRQPRESRHMAGGGRDGDVTALHHQFASTGDRVVRNQLATHYRPLCQTLARRYHRGRERLEDLEQAASIGLLHALDRFDPVRGVPFEAYAIRVISGELKRHYRDRTWGMRVPRALQERYLLVRDTRDRLAASLGRSPTIPDIALAAGLSEDDVLEAMEVRTAYDVGSIDAPARSSSDDDYQRDVGDDDLGFDEIDGRLAHGRILSHLMARLDEAERDVVHLYYWDQLSQAEIGRLLGTSQVSVSRTLTRIHRRLRVIGDEIAGARG